jgi:hypothetical protein
MKLNDLLKWAESVAREDLIAVKRQITEYGSIDLEMMGLGLLDMSKVHPRPDSGETDVQLGLELALVFYLQGKIARAVSAIAAGQRPSADTRRDIRVYAIMWEHVCQFGDWRIQPDDLLQFETVRDTITGGSYVPRIDGSEGPAR